jgi:hypothetical protein
MKKTLTTLAVLAFATTFASAAHATVDYNAGDICKAHFPTDNVSYFGGGVQNHSTTAAVDIFCPIKVVTCASQPCTYTVNAYAVDNNSTSGTDTDVSCYLGFVYRGTAGEYNVGTPQTVGSVGPMTTLGLSVTVGGTGPATVQLYAKCHIGKGGSNYVSWFDTP